MLAGAKPEGKRYQWKIRWQTDTLPRDSFYRKYTIIWLCNFGNMQLSKHLKGRSCCKYAIMQCVSLQVCINIYHSMNQEGRRANLPCKDLIWAKKRTRGVRRQKLTVESNLKEISLSPPDPYVKVWLMFGEKRVEKKKTPVYKCNLNPTFNQVTTNLNQIVFQLWS